MASSIGLLLLVGYETMKLHAPVGCTSVSYRNSPLAIDDGGMIDVDETAAAILAAHGFASVPAAVVVQKEESDEADEFAGLNRIELFAFLRTKGISVSLPITNRALRTAARNALERPMG